MFSAVSEMFDDANEHIKELKICNEILVAIISGGTDFYEICKTYNCTNLASVKLLICMSMGLYTNIYHPEEKFIASQCITSPEVYNLAILTMKDNSDFQSCIMNTIKHCMKFSVNKEEAKNNER